MQKIKTYLVLTDMTNSYGADIGSPIQSYVYGVDQFTPPGINIYSSSTLYPTNNNLDIVITECFFKRTIDDIVKLFTSDNKNISFTIVKFWGKVSQEFTFTEVRLVSLDGDKLSLTFNRQGFSEKNEDNKTWTGVLIPFIRDEKLSKILGDI